MMQQQQQQLVMAGGSQDRLAVPAAPPLAGSSGGAGATAGSSPTPVSVNNPVVISPTDPALRRRRLSNLYKVRDDLMMDVPSRSSFDSLFFLPFVLPDHQLGVL